MNLTLIAVMIVVVTFAISYGESARKTKSKSRGLGASKKLPEGLSSKFSFTLTTSLRKFSVSKTATAPCYSDFYTRVSGDCVVWFSRTA